MLFRSVAEALKLRAEDAEDLEVMSTFLQDALVNVADMAWLKDENRFALVATRFRWEDAPPSASRKLPAERVLCGVSFENVTRVQCRGVDPQTDAGRIVELLTIQGDGEGLSLVLAGGAEIRLSATGISAHLKDLGEPWPVFAKPSHPLED